ncbi:MAG: gluconokinase [Bradyrhizobiaceae bacterium]|jgi:gluconokinase|nr:MAG: gluconokinase [Bradyrhizobiaceae bacterium]
MATDAVRIIVVMGVSGSGKTTISEALAARTGFAEADGDDYHPAANIKKMKAGIPLTDDDRLPWLHAIADAIDRYADDNTPVIIACSALKRAYRDILVHGRKDVRIVYLKGPADLIAQRLKHRSGHFMPPELLKSQIDALEPPQPGEHILTVGIDAPVERIVDTIITALHLPDKPGARTS